MGSERPPAASASDIGVDINNDSGRWSITFDLEKIGMFKMTHGADTFIDIASRHVEAECNRLGLVGDLWLWLEAVRANGRTDG
ncbi:hypothetical protein ACVII1_004328 [Bradyrhizobium elkanii]|uniref:hypothetical protein n=1 Tax=Bradyrhizobium elkanii TaxID=29448 RepID=UPI00351346BA